MSRILPAPVLCYVDEPFAWFTTQALSSQTGDGWHRQHYEHNSGSPYEFIERDREKGLEPWHLIKVAWDGPFVTPCYGHTNSPWSVEMINSRAVAWLRVAPWLSSNSNLCIHAGATIQEFCEFIYLGEGTTYLPNIDSPFLEHIKRYS